jgi:hypothetical protein
LTTPPSPSPPELSSAVPGAPDVVPHLTPIPLTPDSKLSMDLDMANLTSNLPFPLHSSHFESVPVHAVPPQGTTEASAPDNVDGPFRIWRQLSSGGFAKAIGADDMSSKRLLCLKVFRKDRLKRKRTEEGLLNELEVYKRLASSKECCPATIFLMELERCFQTKKRICFAMVCASPLCAIWAVLIRCKFLGSNVE